MSGSSLNRHVKDVDRGPYYLGMETKRDGLYTEKLLEKWGMLDCKPASTPLPSGMVLKNVTTNVMICKQRLIKV